VPILLLLVAIGVVWAAGQINQPSVILPTQAAFALSDLQAPTDTLATTNIIVASATPVLTNTSVSAVTPSVVPLTPTPVATVLPSATIQAVSIAPTDTTVPIAASATPAVTRVPPTANPTSAAPAIPTMVIAGAIPLLEGADIGAGEMLVLDVFRQASTEIANRGGSVPPAPAGEEWVLIELILICDGDENCTPESGTFNLTGTSGGQYPPAAGFQLEPVFGREAFAAGQVWGYLGFVVPDSETGLWLTLGQGSAVYRFALQ
jgi:hypothetical protein